MDQVIQPLRIAAYRDLLRHVPDHVATAVEAYAFGASCRSGDLHGIPVWTYSNGATLFPTERLENHIREMVSSYLDQIERARYMAPMIMARGLVTGADIAQCMSDEQALLDQSPYGKWHEAYLNDLKKAKSVLESGPVDASAPTFIKCRKCGSGAVDTEQKQTRSADEPMTIFCLCRKCETRWTMS